MNFLGLGLRFDKAKETPLFLLGIEGTYFVKMKIGELAVIYWSLIHSSRSSRLAYVCCLGSMAMHTLLW